MRRSDFLPNRALPASARSQEVAAFMSDPEAMLRHLFESARSAPFVAANDAYREAVEPIELRYDGLDPAFNAFAAEARSGPGTEEGGGSRVSMIIILQGYVFWSRIASAGIGRCLAERSRSPAPAMRARLEALSSVLRSDAISVQILKPHVRRWAEDDGAGSFGDFIRGNPEVAAEFSEFLARRRGVESALGSDLSARGALAEARTVLEGMLSWVIAHEIGHICLHHTRRSESPKGWDEISRNQEREADSFASSLLHSRLSRHALLLGALLGELLTAWSQIGGDGSGTHPHSGERFCNLIRSMPSAVADASAIYLLSEEDWLALLPAGFDG